MVAIRETQRGTMLVVILGLLVALFVIGTSFSYITLSERRAASNYLDRQRALDLALDGVEYSIARLREEKSRSHYEYLDTSTAGMSNTVKTLDPILYIRGLDGSNPTVSWPKSKSKTSTADSSNDLNWVDYNGDGIRGGREDAGAVNHFGAGSPYASTVTGFLGEGMNISQIANKDVQRPGEDERYGVSGTYQELGDVFRVRVVDAASLLNINNFNVKVLPRVLSVLGGAIDDWVSPGNSKGEHNPFKAEILIDFMRTFENFGGYVNSKDQLRDVWTRHRNGDYLYNLAMKFITVNSWRDQSYRGWVDSNTKIDDNKNANPLGLTDQEYHREGFTGGSVGRDGWAEWQPESISESSRAPVNINTAPYPVLVAIFANVSAKAPFLYYKREDLITITDKLQGQLGASVKRMNVGGTTDYGRQSIADVASTGISNEESWSPPGAHNRAIFQLIDIGPISTKVGDQSKTKTNSGNEAGSTDIAVNLALEIIKMRSNRPFQSWQDFDSRFFRNLLLNMPIDGSGMKVPDLVGTDRRTIDSKGTPSPSENLLPLAENVDNVANPFKASGAAMSQPNFKAWYWKSCVDMLRANFNPNNVTNRYNADYPYHQNVDRMDLTFSTSPLCFSSMGVFEIISQGEILAPPSEIDGHTQVGNITKSRIMARRQIRTTVKIYDVLRHTSQRDFMTPLDPSQYKLGATTSANTRPQTYVPHTRHGTKSYPSSVDEFSNGSHEDSRPTYIDDQEDAKNITYEVYNPSSPGNVEFKNKWKGHAEFSKSSSNFGYVGMDPKDRTPVVELRDGNIMTFHSRFNESLNSRHYDASKNNLMSGVLSDAGILADIKRGKNPVETNALFDDFVSSATPRSKGPAVNGSSKEFSDKFGQQATTYSSLQPDGVYLHGGSLRGRATKGNVFANTYFGRRGAARPARLKILRYPCGSHYTDKPFFPIKAVTTATALESGVDDRRQEGYADPAANDDANGRLRLEGTAPDYSGSDNHNREREGDRQRYSNMPYYEGVVDFWIKWSAPPQGSMINPSNPVTVAMGEVDPASHNFSGLFGATAFGRVSHIVQNAGNTSGVQTINDINRAESDFRDRSADIEGIQFFVYKEPGGVLRFTRLYFMEAFGLKVASGSTGTGTAAVTRFGRDRRIADITNLWGGYTASGDICPNSSTNRGFLYARTDAWVDLSTAQNTFGSGDQRTPKLRVHDWHRFTLEYNSNTTQPYRLWIDGRRIGPIEFYDDPDGSKGWKNDGSHLPGKGAPVPVTGTGANDQVAFYRSMVKLNEINPEDRLTVGCIFRRQRDIADPQVWATYYAENIDDVGGTKQTRPVFRFDSNFVAVANATIDDFRITNQLLTGIANDMDPNNVAQFSRYASISETQNSSTRPYFEHGFLPVRSENLTLHSTPVRLGSISWTEVRPDWDPYGMTGLDLAKSARLSLEWAVFKDVGTMNTGGARTDSLNTQKPEIRGIASGMTSINPKDRNYWARGGVDLEGAILPAGSSIGAFVYRFYFEAPDGKNVNNVTAFLDDVTLTLLTPPRRLSFSIDY